MPKVTQLALKGNHQVVPCSSDLESFVLIFFHEQLSIFVNLLLDQEITNSQGCVTRTTPSSFTRGNVASRCKKVGTEYLFFGSNMLVALSVQTESVKLGPKCGAILIAWGCCCKKAIISR
jgi:hypothetical protein